MHHPCVASTISLGSRGWFSFSFNENPRWLSECHPSACCVSRVCCCCGYCYGLRQSSLIQWSSYRKLVLGGFDPCSQARVSVYDVGRSCCCNRTRYLREKSGNLERKERLRKIMVFEERSERRTDEIIDEAEIVLNLLADTVDSEYLHVSREGRRIARVNIEEDEENHKISNKLRGKMKRADAGVAVHEFTCYRKQEDQALSMEENAARVRNSSSLANCRAGRKLERRVLLREMSQRDDEKEYEEEEEKFVKEKRWNSRKDESSCSSYYTSKSDYESDEVQDKQDMYLKDSSFSHERNSRSKEVISKVVEEGDKIHEDRREEYGIGISKKTYGDEFIAGSSSVESEFRKKSEKKLTDASVEEMESRQKISKHLIEQETNYVNSSDNYVSYDDRKDKSTRTMSFNEENKQKRNGASDAVSVDSERLLKYKHVTNVIGTENIDVKSSHNFQKSMYHEKSDKSSSIASSSHKERQNVVGKTTIDEHNRSSIEVSELSETQKIEMRKTSISHQSSETTTSKEDNYAAFLSSKNDTKKQQIEFNQVSGQVVSERQSLSQSEIQNRTLLKQSDQILKHKEKVNSVELGELHSQAYFEHIEEGQTVIGSDEKKNISITKFSKEDREDVEGDELPDEQTSMLVLQEDGVKSARRVEKSSTSCVDEYVDQVRHEVLSSESKKETKTGAFEILHEEEQLQQNVVTHASGDSQSEKHHSGGDDSSSGVEGPSVEMWKEQESSINRQSEAASQADEIKTGNELAKRSGKSLWNVLGDFFRFKLFQQSDGDHSSRRTQRRSPQTQSVASEAWFSSNEAEEPQDAGINKGDKAARVSRRGRRLEKTQFQVEEGSSSSNSEGHLKTERLQSSTIIGSSPSDGVTSGGIVGVTSPVVVNDSSTPSPASRLQRSPVIQGSVEAGEANAPDNEIRSISTGSMVYSDSTIDGEKLKRGMLRRADQIQRDRFDDWEDAYKLETEQRKNDEMFMREALLEAKKAADHWEVPVGAVLVHNGKIIARGCNLVEELRDSTAHAEMICIRQASNLLRTWRLSETILYVTLEPCPMCAGAILQARIDTVVWGAPNKLLGADGSWIRLFPNGGNGSEQSEKPPPPVHPFHPKITIRRGILGSECADTMQQFFKLRRKKKDVKVNPPSPQTSCLPIPHRHSNILSKMHHPFTLMFSL